MKGALLPGTEPDPPRGRFNPDVFYLEHLAVLAKFFQRTARRLGIDAGDDTLQDVYFKLRDNHEHVDITDPRTVLAWCKKAGTNHLLDLLRSGYHSFEEPHSTFAIIDAERERGALSSPEEQWADRDALRRSLVRMPEKLAEVFLLDADGYSRAEIAELLGITPNAVGIRLTRARAYARNRLGAFVAGLVPFGVLAQVGSLARRAIGKPTHVIVTGIGSLSVVLAFGMPVVPGTVELPARVTQGVAAQPTSPTTPAEHHVRHAGTGRRSSVTVRVPVRGHTDPGAQAAPNLVPRVPRTCGPHICVSSDCPGAHETGDRVYLKPTNDPCGVAIVESYAPACQYVADNPVVGCHREGDPRWAVNPPPSPITKGGPL